MKERTMRNVAILLLVACATRCPAQAGQSPTARQLVDPASFTWLGPLPDRLTKDGAQHALVDAVRAIKDQLDTELAAGSRPESFIDLTDFVCRKPAEVGPVPGLDALEHFIRNWPESEQEEASVRAVVTAADQGNWLARSWLLGYVVRDQTDPVHIYRLAQLLDWLRQNHIGTSYAFLGDVLSSPHRPARGSAQILLHMYAAKRNSYVAQYNVGRMLLESLDPERAAIGQRMLDCAASALPGYGRVLVHLRPRDHGMAF